MFNVLDKGVIDYEQAPERGNDVRELQSLDYFKPTSKGFLTIPPIIPNAIQSIQTLGDLKTEDPSSARNFNEDRSENTHQHALSETEMKDSSGSESDEDSNTHPHAPFKTEMKDSGSSESEEYSFITLPRVSKRPIQRTTFIINSSSDGEPDEDDLDVMLTHSNQSRFRIPENNDSSILDYLEHTKIDDGVYTKGKITSESGNDGLRVTEMVQGKSDKDRACVTEMVQEVSGLDKCDDNLDPRERGARAEAQRRHIVTGDGHDECNRSDLTKQNAKEEVEENL